MAPRANWKGFLKIAELTCPIALYTAVSTSERVAFHTLNRKTGHRVRRQFVDQETGRLVEPADQVKGYEVGKGDFVVLEPEEIAAAFPDSDKTIDIERFIACSDIDDVYFDRPYYLGPADPVAQNAFGVIRDGMRSEKVAALARTVLFRRVRTLLIRPNGKGMIATLLNFDYEVRPPRDAFQDVPKQKITGEMLDLAKHIIRTKRGKFDPKKFDDRYESALAELVKAKLEGRVIKAPEPPKSTNVVDLMDALRQSAHGSRSARGKASTKGPKSRRSGNRKSTNKNKRPAEHAQHRRKAG